jgi:hypothetical protein
MAFKDNGTVCIFTWKRQGEPEAMIFGVQLMLPEKPGLSLAEQTAVKARRRTNLAKMRKTFPETTVQHSATPRPKTEIFLHLLTE